jgi:hypothetical protein
MDLSSTFGYELAGQPRGLQHNGGNTSTALRVPETGPVIFLLVPAWIVAVVAAVWILSRRSWPWRLRIPGCVILVPIAAWVGWLLFAAVLIAVLQVIS